MCNDWIYFSNKEKKNTFFKHFTFSVFHETRKKSTALTDDAGNPVQQIGRGMKFHAGHVSHTDITAAVPVYSGWGFKYPLCLCFSLQLKDNRRNMQVSPHTAWPLVCFAFSHTYEQKPLQKIVIRGATLQLTKRMCLSVCNKLVSKHDQSQTCDPGQPDWMTWKPTKKASIERI